MFKYPQVSIRTKNDVEVFVCFMNGVLMLEISSGAELEKNPQLYLSDLINPKDMGGNPLVFQPSIPSFRVPNS